MNVISEDYAKEKCFFEDLTEGKVIECDPFSLLKPSKANKQLLPKWGISFTDDQEKINEYHSDDEDDELVFEKQEKPDFTRSTWGW